MNTAIKTEPYCYDLRGKDTETALIGPITARIIDADRMVRLDFRNGFPNWMLYRTALAGDALYLAKLREWTIAFTWVLAAHGVKRKTITDELVGCAALDALSIVLYTRELQPYTVTADSIGVHHKTYRRLRDGVARRLKLSLNEYWIRLIVAYGYILNYERKCGLPQAALV